VYYVDDNGKARSQLYKLVAGEMSPSAAPAAKGAAKPSGAPTASAATQSAAAPAEKTGQAPAAAAATTRPRETVKCSFSSTPSGAEVTLDGRYVGSTPSVLGVTTGTHVVVISMAGFAQWKRDLAVTAGSDLTVNAVLQKAQ